MTDARLRDLERRWRETGSVDDEAAWLAGRLRVGRLRRDRLELAALVGHEAARLLVPDAPTHDVLCDRCFAVAERGKEPALRMAIAACRAVLRSWRWPHGPPEPELALRAAEAWLACPCDDHAERARHAAEEVASGVFEREGEEGLLFHHTPDSRPALAFVATARLAAASRLGATERGDAVRIVTDCDRVLDDTPALESAVRAELVAWALGSASRFPESGTEPLPHRGLPGSQRR